MIAALALTLALAQGPAVAPDQAQDKAAAKLQKDIQDDIDQGKKYVLDVEKTYKLSDNEAMMARAKRIGAEMAEIANNYHAKALWGDKRFCKFEYTFKVIQGDDVNAFSLPGGFIYINEGLMTYVESDDELAGVLAHEIAHASLRHVATIEKQLEKESVWDIPVILAAILSGGNTGKGLILLNQAKTQGNYSGWSQQAEQAADHAGFEYITHSKYNPTGMLTVVERLARDERNKPKIDWGIFRTHPPSQKRANDISKWMGENKLVAHRSQVTKSFSTQLKGKDDGSVEAWFDNKKIFTFSGADADSRAKAAAERLNAFFDATPALMDIQAQDGKILGLGKVLFQVMPEDAEKQSSSVPTLAESAVKGIRTAVFSLNYQLWQK